jgi:Uma2 family endonuclease
MKARETLPGRATYEDLLKVPDHLVAELLDGELVVSPRPAPRHAAAASAIGGQVWGPFHGAPGGPGGPGGWWILYEPEVHFGDTVLVPDLAGWRLARLPELPDTPYFTVAPDWVCEVLSPHTVRLDKTRKLPVYAREGVGRAWLVDPAERTLEVFRLDGGRWVPLGSCADEAVVRAEPFEAVELQIGHWWVPQR